jgi:hypothetical protein
VFTGAIYATPYRRTVLITWDPAKDEGPVRYWLYRDGRNVGNTRALAARFLLPCGKHRYRVQAIDTRGQRDSLTITVTRHCPRRAATTAIP